MISLFGLYAIELLARNNGLPVAMLEWWPLRSGNFAPWQPITHWFVQGRGVTSALLAGLVLMFFLPTLVQAFTRRQLQEALGATLLGGAAAVLLVDLTGMATAPTMGWSVMGMAAVVLFGLANPNATVNLWFILPVPAKAFVWLAGAAALFSLSSGGLFGAEQVGAWLGVYGWYHLRGPGARRRSLQHQARSIERELRRFTVIEGGKSDNNDLVN